MSFRNNKCTVGYRPVDDNMSFKKDKCTVGYRPVDAFLTEIIIMMLYLFFHKSFSNSKHPYIHMAYAH